MIKVVKTRVAESATEGVQEFTGDFVGWLLAIDFDPRAFEKTWETKKSRLS